MKVTKFYHSCILIQEGDTNILVDPGKYSFLEGQAKPEEFENLSAIFLTHEHADHADPNAIEKILKKNPVPIYGNAGTCEALRKAGISVQLLKGPMKIGEVEIEPLSAHHEFILSGLPENTAYRIGGKLLITGDSLDANLYAHKNIPLLAMPVLAPWMNQQQAADFLKAMKPLKIIPVHDGFVKDAFLIGQYKNWEAFCKEAGILFEGLIGPDRSLEA